MVLDDPLQPAGTKLSYKVYMGSWGGHNGKVGGSNENGECAEHFMWREVVGEDVPGVSAIPVSAMPDGSTIQQVRQKFHVSL